jgi:CRP-like cAMP-binding protein
MRERLEADHAAALAEKDLALAEEKSRCHTLAEELAGARKHAYATIVNSCDNTDDAAEVAEKIIQGSILHGKSFEQRQLKKQQSMRDSIKERILARNTLRKSRKLQQTELFRYLGTEAIGKVIEAMDYRLFEAGVNIVVQGEAASELMVIMGGTASVLIDGNKVRSFESLDIIGEGALVSGDHVRSATVAADSVVGVLVLGRDRYEEFLGDGTIVQEVHEHARRMSARYTLEDAGLFAGEGKRVGVPTPPPGPPPSSPPVIA